MSVGFGRIVKGRYYTKKAFPADVDTELNRYFGEGPHVLLARSMAMPFCKNINTIKTIIYRIILE
jgi:hypothetical protein